MGKPDWTKEQKQVIELRDRNILVSAAAGSGKTAVLVERIIAEITQGPNPKDIDKLLVVTFTKAAAAEMRTRIGNALEAKLLEDPENQHIQKQASLLHTAQITTIDSFCQSILKNYFHVIGLDPSFRVGDETELELLKQEVLEDLIEEKYRQAREEGNKEFLFFTDMLATGRTDHAVEEMVLSLDTIAASYPWKEEWLSGCAELYGVKGIEEMETAEWMKELCAYLKLCVGEYLEMAQKALCVCEEVDGPSVYLNAIRSDIRMLEGMQGEKSYREYQRLFESYNPARLKAARSKDVNGEKKDFVKNMREAYLKNGLAKIKERFFFQSAEEMLFDIQAMAPAMGELFGLTIEFGQAFAERKREEGLLDFADMEHFALEILTERDGDKVRPSQTALDLQEHYEEILTDEYQDSNYIQELLLTSLCRAPEAKPYLFMVGDVKQSIYQFRLARPELFLEKYKSYTVGKGPFQRIDLHANFRSREGVLASANYLFKEIMQESLGGIVYDEAASLVAEASFEETEKRVAGKTEVLLVEQKSDDLYIGKKSLEAAVIGEKIRDMVQGENPLYVSGKNGYRPVQYRDIAILLRSLSGWSEEFLETLDDMGIPAYADIKTGYFTSLEVETILNLLHIIDNPRQDIPLVSVLRSCFYQITDEELAWIGSMAAGINFWDKVQEFVMFVDWKREGKEQREKLFLDLTEKWAMEKEQEDILYQKLRFFLDRLEEYQKFAKLYSVYELLRKIYHETGYYYIMAAMPSGGKRRANLDILLEHSVEFAKIGHQGIYGFTRYIENLRKANVDFGEAAVNGENTNAVRIMTIHKSKGLEFPVVFVAGMGKQFNLMDARKATVMDGDFGAGCDFVDLEFRIKQPTLIKRFLANHITLNTLAEEIRILYVALTRAKEQLILTGTASGLEKKIKGWMDKAGYLNFSQLSSAQNYLAWIMPALFKRDVLRKEMNEYLDGQDGREIFQSSGKDVLFNLEVYFPEDVVSEEKKSLEGIMSQYRMLQNWDTEKVYDGPMRRALEKRVSYQYPYAREANLPVKISVSELKRRSLLYAERLQEENTVYMEFGALKEKESSWHKKSGRTEVPEAENMLETEIPKPKFLQESQDIKGTAKGTLYHLVMEHFPYRQIKGKITAADFGVYLDGMVKRGYLGENERKVLDDRKFVAFIRSGIGQRMKKAEEEGRLRREQPFMIGLGADEVDLGQDSQEMIMVQGIIDAFFFEGDEIVLVDYKTDFVKRGQEWELVQKYQVQLGYYAKALERLGGRRVKEKVIYSFALGKEICVE